MFADGVPLPLKVLACVPALMYGAMIFLARRYAALLDCYYCSVYFGVFCPCLLGVSVKRHLARVCRCVSAGDVRARRGSRAAR